VSHSFSTFAIRSTSCQRFTSQGYGPDSTSPSVPVNDSLDIVIECAPDGVESPAVNGLALAILDVEGGQWQLDSKKISDTTWNHYGFVEMYVVNKSISPVPLLTELYSRPPLTNQLLFFARSTAAGDIGHLFLIKDDWDDWDKIQDNSPSEKCR